MNLRTFLLCTRFTIIDELHHKSFYILTLIAVVFTLMLRGCFTGNYVINGQQINGVSVGWHASIVGFHIISFGGVLIAILLSMRTFIRDRDNGMVVAILSKPVKRWEYVSSKVFGLWILSYGLTLILHITVYVIMKINTGGWMIWFLPASLITSLNVFAVIVIMLLFSLFLPDVLAAFVGIVLTFVSLAIDSVYVVSRNSVVQNMINQTGNPEGSSWWVWIIWPKITALQYFATSLIKQSPFHFWGPIHPAVNVILYACAAYVALLFVFKKKEIT